MRSCVDSGSGAVDDEGGGVVVLVGLEEYGSLWRRAYDSEFEAADADLVSAGD